MTMTNWTDVAAEADLFEGAGIAVTPEGQDIALFSVEGEVFAINNLCTHGNATLAADGRFVEGACASLTRPCSACGPLHPRQRQVVTRPCANAPSTKRSSACAMARWLVAPPQNAAKTWPVKVEGGRVFLQLG